MKVNQEIIQQIDCLTVKDLNPHTAIVMLHGYGANMRDLFPLWEMWHKSGFDWYFPNGVLSLPMGFYEGRAWFSIDIEELEKSMREGTTRDLSSKVPDEFLMTIKKLKDFVSFLRPKYKYFILGGFSQGAMCASHLSCQDSLNVNGLILLSGSLLANEKFPSSAPKIPFYQSHGTQDPILSVHGAKNLYEKLVSLGLNGEFHTFQGVHEIPYSVTEKVKKFLNQFAH